MRGSGPLAAADAALLARLPADTFAIFGGNYLAMQRFMADGPMQAVEGIMDKAVPGAGAWTSCYTERFDAPNAKMVGALSMAPGGVAMRIVSSGVDLATLKGCADQAGLPATLDADGRYLAVELPAPSPRAVYLALPTGELYTKAIIALPLPGFAGGTPPPIDRAALDADLAALATGTAATAANLAAAMAKVDRSRAVWFVADASSTPFAKYLGVAYGTFDVGDALEIDVAFDVQDAALAATLPGKLAEARREFASPPPALRAQMAALAPAVDSVRLAVDGSVVRGRARITSAQFSGLMSLGLAPGMPGQP